MVSEFTPGLKLSEMFFGEVVKKIIESEYPHLRYTAALIGPGSEVIGFDDSVSSDHHWGLRLYLFIDTESYDKHYDSLIKLFRTKLPFEFKGHSTHWSLPDPNDSGNQFPQFIKEGEVNHRIEIFTVNKYLKKQFNLENTDLTDIDWLLLPEQKLLEFTSGKIFYDSLGELLEIRDKFAYLPENVWKYKLLSEWEHIAQEIAFAGRTGEVEDEIGSKIESSRLIRYVMRLAFLLSRRYTPYTKWFGTVFSQLKIAEKLEPLLLAVFKEEDWKQRDKLLCKAYMFLVEEQNKLELTPKILVEPIPFFSRNMTIIDVKKVIEELKKTIKPPLDKVPPIGAVDQLMEVGGGLEAEFAEKARVFYDE
ncbi:MAG: DUF4037 domain-containing protein [Candidatus Heimdallarchaeota archaeon]|nr:DUF4037 domain-containing protein [Candidatus Heimdallarchaeota archaeon]